MSVVGERTAEESSPPGVVEEPGVSRGLHLRLATFSGGCFVVLGLFSAVSEICGMTSSGC